MKTVDEMKQELAQLSGTAQTSTQSKLDPPVTAAEKRQYEKYIQNFRPWWMQEEPWELQEFVETHRKFAHLTSPLPEQEEQAAQRGLNQRSRRVVTTLSQP